MPKLRACVLLQLNAPSTRAGATPASANVVDSAAAGMVEGVLLDVVAVGLTTHPPRQPTHDLQLATAASPACTGTCTTRPRQPSPSGSTARSPTRARHYTCLVYFTQDEMVAGLTDAANAALRSDGLQATTRRALPFWAKVGAPRTVLRWISRGVTWPFRLPPPPFHQRNPQ